MNHTIPEHHIEFARKVAQLAREAGLRRFSLTVTPGLTDPWDFDVETSWRQDSDDLAITSNVRIVAVEAVVEPTPRRSSAYFRCGGCGEIKHIHVLREGTADTCVWCASEKEGHG